ncbi:sugar ABC transporter permease [Nonomuraea sp. NPDC005983]|uniref:carbohydrate ABC transporter permease n=1 Tax=Nonomuraea sp. NPDC005983 TaxID=3155595 RepID=UPI0033BE4D53
MTVTRIEEPVADAAAPPETSDRQPDVKPKNNRAWLLVLPVVVSVAFTAVIPLMTVVNFSVQDIFSPSDRIFVGLEWFRSVSRDPEVRSAFLRTLMFSAQVLLVEIPLGVAIAVSMPRRGVWVSAALVVVALPLLIPWNVVGTIWQIFARADIGLGGWTVNNVLGVDFNYTLDSTDAWITVLVMDVWHWTPLVALLAYAGLRSIPDPYFQAAQIDGASGWATFRHIQLPRLRGVLTIAILLRFMDSFMIYTEPFVVTGGGPGNATSFLSILLSKIAVGQFDLGPAGAFSLLYFLIVQIVSYVFFTVLTRSGR